MSSHSWCSTVTLSQPDAAIRCCADRRCIGPHIRNIQPPRPGRPRTPTPPDQRINRHPLPNHARQITFNCPSFSTCYRTEFTSNAILPFCAVVPWAISWFNCLGTRRSRSFGCANPFVPEISPIAVGYVLFIFSVKVNMVPVHLQQTTRTDRRQGALVRALL